MATLCEKLQSTLEGEEYLPEGAQLLEDLCWDSEGIVYPVDQIPEGLDEVRVVRGGEVVNVSSTDLTKEKKHRKILKKKPHKRRGPMSATQKAHIKKALAKSNKVKKRAGI